MFSSDPSLKLYNIVYCKEVVDSWKWTHMQTYVGECTHIWTHSPLQYRWMLNSQTMFSSLSPWQCFFLYCALCSKHKKHSAPFLVQKPLLTHVQNCWDANSHLSWPLASSHWKGIPKMVWKMSFDLAVAFPCLSNPPSCPITLCQTAKQHILQRHWCPSDQETQHSQIHKLLKAMNFVLFNQKAFKMVHGDINMLTSV